MTDGAGVPTGTPLTEPPLIEMISEDPVLRNSKMIAEAWDCDGLNQVGAFPHYGGRWSEWNGHFRDTVRQFIKVSRLLMPSFAANCGRVNHLVSLAIRLNFLTELYLSNNIDTEPAATTAVVAWLLQL